MNTITKLQAELEELEKRIKAISTAQNSLAKLNEISEYFNTVQTYLALLNEDFNNHIIESQEYSTQIEELQNSIATLTDKVNEIAGGSGIDLSQIEQSIATLQEELTALKSGSTATIMDLEEHIENLEGEHDLMEENITQNSTDISTINQIIAEMQTTLTNITTTQNSLSSTQSNLTSTVSGINSRLTKAEANISTLTEGVDVSEIDSRITNLESNKNIIKNNYKMLLNVTTQTPLYSLFYYYKTSDENCVVQKFNLKYTSNGTGTLKIDLLQNGIVSKTINVNLEQHSSNFEFEYIHSPTYTYQNFQFLFTLINENEDTIMFDELEAVLIGENLELFETDKDLKASCFDGNIYVLRYDDHQIKMSKTTFENLSINPVDLTNPNFNKMETFRTGTYGPMMASSGGIAKVTYDCLTAENATDNSYKMYTITSSGDTVLNNKNLNFSPMVVIDTHIEGMMLSISEGKPITSFATNAGTATTKIKNLENYMSGNWYYATIARANYYINNETSIIPRANPLVLAYYEDGNVYAINKMDGQYISKVGKGGKFITAYYQDDKSINVYINHYNKTDKYNLVPKGNVYVSNYVETIKDCDCVYELTNNAYIKHSSLGWSLHIPQEEVTDQTELT